jgi:tRNA-modifying protein YgfZ
MVKTMQNENAASFEEQYQALRSGCGIVELTNWSSIAVTGSDRQKFLHSFCTNNINRLTPGDNCEAFFTNVKGKIVGHGIVVCRDDELAIVGVPSQSEGLVAHLDRYIIREDVQLRDTTSELCCFLATGKLAADIEARSTRLNCNLVGNEREWLIGIPFQEAVQFLSFMQQQGFARADQAFYAAKTEAGFPLFFVDFDETNLPQEVGRDRQAISYTKGCYLGQETVARIDALGHVNQRIVGVKFLGAANIDPGLKLTLGNSNVGHVTSFTFSPRLNAPLSLAMVRREANAIGTQLGSAAGECEVIALPV